MSGSESTGSEANHLDRTLEGEGKGDEGKQQQGFKSQHAAGTSVTVVITAEREGVSHLPLSLLPDGLSFNIVIEPCAVFLPARVWRVVLIAIGCLAVVALWIVPGLVRATGGYGEEGRADGMPKTE